MWIRSQNKKVLVVSDYVEIVQLARSDNLYCDECQIVTKKNGKYITLGSYSTKEKALEVLNAIQGFIKSMYVGNGEYMGYPFQMPKDDEVFRNET